MQKIIVGHYLLQEQLGAGGMGTVYQGLDTENQQTVAVKQLHPNLTDQQLIERFKREGEALRELNHPNIVKMLDAVEENGNHYLIMEYISGADLAEHIKAGQMPLEEILNISIDLADALTRAHRLNIIHRDLKPANVLIAEDGTLRLTDFGVAHVGSKERVTDTDAVIGTIDYLPPEAFDSGTFDARGDIWAFGVMLFEMLTRERPFHGESIIQVIQAISSNPLPDLEELRPDIPTALIDLIYRMLERDLLARIPSVRIVGAELEAVLQGRSTDTPAEPRFETPVSTFFKPTKHNLPLQTTAFVGRDEELAELSNLLVDDSIRLMTILAPGGMGKTRLSLEAARQAFDNFTNGVYFVELAPLSSGEQIVPAIATAVEYSFIQDGREQKQQILDFLSNKKLLLVMDNFEHLLDSAAIVSDILTVAENVQIMATSRQRLGLSGETVLYLGGMDFPNWETPEDALEYAAVKLFMNSARYAQPNFELTSDNLNFVARICRLVQGMPLGIVLSGAWVVMLTLDEIASELEQGIDILTDELGEFPERQQSIRVVMEYSWQMMTEPEQAAFMKLSVFKKGFTREAAQIVAGANLRILMSLVTKSLLRRDSNSGRYEIHELLRQYAHEKLEESGNLEECYRSHTVFFAEFLAEKLPLLKGGGQLKAIDLLDADFENCRAAWLWAIAQKDEQLVGSMIDSLHLYLTFHYWHEIAYELFEMARIVWHDESSLSGRLNARFLELQASEDKINRLETGLAIAQHDENQVEIAFCQRELGLFFGHHSSTEPEIIQRGIGYLEECLNNYEALDDRFYVARVWDDIAYCYTRLVQEDKRAEYSKRSIELRREIGDVVGLGLAVAGYVGTIMFQDPQEAKQLLDEAYETGQRTNNAYLMFTTRAMHGTYWLTIGDLEAARMAYLDTLAISQSINNDFGQVVGNLALSTISCLLDNDAEKAKEHIDKAHSLPKDSQIYTDYAYMTHNLLSQFSYTMTIGDFEGFENTLQQIMKFYQLISATPNTLTTIAFATLLLKHRGQKERAVRWLGFALNHPWASGLLKILPKWQAMIDFENELRAGLGDEKYDSLIEEGKTLQLETVYAELIAEFGS